MTSRKNEKHHYMRGTLAERFWPKINKDGPTPPHAPHLGPCWVWLAGMAVRGYGAITDGGGEIGKPGAKHRANRVAWVLTHGPIAPEAKVLHRCDNPACVRPDHLFVGTQADNIADKVAKGRQFRRQVSAAGMARIREMRAGGVPLKQVAAEQQMSVGTLLRILKDPESRTIPRTLAALDGGGSDV